MLQDTYLKKEIFLPIVNEQDEVLGKEERWHVHRNGILHQAFTVQLLLEGKTILQHRKHIVFDGYFDATILSHPMWLPDEERFQTIEEAIYYTVKREWDIEESELHNLRLKEQYHYRAYDHISNLIEHEMNNWYVAEIDTLKPTNYDVAYGYSVVEEKHCYENKAIEQLLAPWLRKEYMIPTK